jgi:hypothetical protein
VCGRAGGREELLDQEEFFQHEWTKLT